MQDRRVSSTDLNRQREKKSAGKISVVGLRLKGSVV